MSSKLFSSRILTGIVLISALHIPAVSSANALQMYSLEQDHDSSLILAEKKKKKNQQQQQNRSSGSGGGQSRPRSQSPQRVFQGPGQGSSRSGQGSRGSQGENPSRQRSGSQDIQRRSPNGASQRRSGNSNNQSSQESQDQKKRNYPLSSPYRKDDPDKKRDSTQDRRNPNQTNQKSRNNRFDEREKKAPGSYSTKKTNNNQNTKINKTKVKQNVNVKSKTNVYVRNKNVVNVKRRLGPVAIRRGSWCRRGWVVARPWRYGWYGGWRPAAVVYPGWGWWAATAPAWGALTLSPTIVIQQSVDSAVASDSRYIDVPNSEFRIYHASISPIGPEEIEFDFEIDGDSYRAKADCKNGLLNDETPSALDEAELMHAACTIAFSSLNDQASSLLPLPAPVALLSAFR
jgi:hypothetical protein